MDRGTKATLTLTIPRSIFKSSTKDLSLPIFEIVIQHRLLQPFCVHSKCRHNVIDLGQPARSCLFLLHE